jgi:predicted amidohydrolase YtcJ
MWGFTGAPAYGAFLDGRAGVIREGALADWVVLDKPIESYDVEELRVVKVKETWVAGKRVYIRPDDN